MINNWYEIYAGSVYVTLCGQYSFALDDCHPFIEQARQAWNLELEEVDAFNFPETGDVCKAMMYDGSLEEFIRFADFKLNVFTISRINDRWWVDVQPYIVTTGDTP